MMMLVMMVRMTTMIGPRFEWVTFLWRNRELKEIWDSSKFGLKIRDHDWRWLELEQLDKTISFARWTQSTQATCLEWCVGVLRPGRTRGVSEKRAAGRKVSSAHATDFGSRARCTCRDTRNVESVLRTRAWGAKLIRILPSREGRLLPWSSPSPSSSWDAGGSFQQEVCVDGLWLVLQQAVPYKNVNRGHSAARLRRESCEAAARMSGHPCLRFLGAEKQKEIALGRVAMETWERSADFYRGSFNLQLCVALE